MMVNFFVRNCILPRIFEVKGENNKLRDLESKLREDGKMKNIIIILSILFTLSLAGVLYGIILQPDEGESVTADYYVYMNQYPDPLPDFVLY